MKKYIKLLLLFLMIVTLVGCTKDDKKENYTIKFQADNGVAYEDVVIEEQQTIDLPLPEKKGYKFLGWYPSKKFVKDTEVTKDTIVGKNITLYAKWETIPITVKLDLNGGIADSEVLETYNIRSTQVIELPDVHKDGHIFLGWYVGGEECESKVSFLEDTTVVAKFVSLNELESQYNISLELNGGTFYNFDEPLEQSIIESRDYRGMINENHSDEINKLHYLFVMDYCEFLGRNYWREGVKYEIFDQTYNRIVGNNGFLNNDYFLGRWIWLFQYLEYLALAQNKPYFEDIYNGNYIENSDQYFTPSACIRIELAGFIYVDQYVYGDNMFVSHEYTVEDLENIKKYFNINSYVPGQETPLLAPMKDGYVFRGWYDNPEFEGDPIWKINDRMFGDIKLYAKWEEI